MCHSESEWYATATAGAPGGHPREVLTNHNIHGQLGQQGPNGREGF